MLHVNDEEDKRKKRLARDDDDGNRRRFVGSASRGAGRGRTHPNRPLGIVGGAIGSGLQVASSLDLVAKQSFPSTTTTTSLSVGGREGGETTTRGRTATLCRWRVVVSSLRGLLRLLVVVVLVAAAAAVAKLAPPPEADKGGGAAADAVPDLAGLHLTSLSWW